MGIWLRSARRKMTKQKTRAPRQKIFTLRHTFCGKNVQRMIDGRDMMVLIDTGSDILLMHADEYMSMGSPRFRSIKIWLLGLGSRILNWKNFGPRLPLTGILIRFLFELSPIRCHNRNYCLEFLECSRNECKTRRD